VARSISDLEHELRQTFDRANLAVYADALLATDDLRGELCAIDLLLSDQEPPPNADVLQARRAEIATQLVGATHVKDPAIRTTFGFVTLNRPSLALLDAILMAPLGTYVRDLALEGSGAQLAACLTTLARSPRPWLARLAIKQTEYSGDGNIPQALADLVIAATPNVTELLIAGRKLFARFAHPKVARLELTGADAIGALATTGQGGMPGVVALDYRFAFGGSMPRWDRRRVLLPSQFPCVTELDLTRNAVMPATSPQSDTDLFRFLRTLSIAPQLQRLCLPQILDDDALANAQSCLERNPDLRELVVIACSRAERLVHPRAKITQK